MSYEVHQVQGAARFAAADRTRVDRRSQWWILGLLFGLLLALGGVIVALHHSSGGADAAAMRSIATDIQHRAGLVGRGDGVGDHTMIAWQERHGTDGPGPYYEGGGVVLGRSVSDVAADLDAAVGSAWQGRTTVDDGPVHTQSYVRGDGMTLHVTVAPVDDADRAFLPDSPNDPTGADPVVRVDMRVDRATAS